MKIPLYSRFRQASFVVSLSVTLLVSFLWNATAQDRSKIETDGVATFPMRVMQGPVLFVCLLVLLLLAASFLVRKMRKAHAGRRIWVFLVRKHRRKLQRQKADLERANAELSAMNARLAALATTDGLTGLKNHRAFVERLNEEFQRGLRYNTRLSVMMVDVDHFKQLNDTLGHPAGDIALKTIANILRSNARSTDIVARYGGEEFGIILPETDSDAAMEVAERLRLAIERYPWHPRAITVSIGVAAMKPATDTPADLVQEADEALYASKRTGRNRVTRYTPSPIVSD